MTASIAANRQPMSTTMDNSPLVSVLMPVFNTQEFVGHAVESILNQTFLHFEFIIIDDCSTDNSWDILCKYATADNRVILSRNTTNLGIAGTRNACFAARSPVSKYSAIMDADDISVPDRLKMSVAYLEEHPEVGIVGGNIVIIDRAAREIGKRTYSGYDVNRTVYTKSPFAQPSVMIRNSVLDRAGMYDQRYAVAEDLDLWFRILEHSKGHNLNDVLLKYRLSSSQSKNARLKQTIVNTIRIKRYYLKKHKVLMPPAYLRILFEYVLLLLPSVFIMKLFQKIEFQR